MANLLFYRLTPSITKAAKPTINTNNTALLIVGIFLVLFVAAAIYFYTINQPEVGRTVIDLAVAFLAFAAGRSTGEKTGLDKR